MNFRTPWFVRLPLIILTLSFPMYFTYSNPYWIFGGKEKEALRRYRNYSQVHYKNEEDVKVHTEESKLFYIDLAGGNFPVPLYGKHLTDEEISDKGLYVIRASS